jgi:hypothetical protein
MKTSLENTKARQFVADVRAKISDETLQEKYGFSSRKFYFYKASALDIIAKEDAQRKHKRSIKVSAKEFLIDIRSGMDEEALMIRYGLEPRQLQSAFRQIINAGLATPMELSKRLSITKSQVREAFVEVGKAIKELD